MHQQLLSDVTPREEKKLQSSHTHTPLIQTQCAKAAPARQFINKSLCFSLGAQKNIGLIQNCKYSTMPAAQRYDSHKYKVSYDAKEK